jgi:hypothetical protein
MKYQSRFSNIMINMKTGKPVGLFSRYIALGGDDSETTPAAGSSFTSTIDPDD